MNDEELTFMGNGEEYEKLVQQHGLPLVAYCSLLAPICDMLYCKGDDSSDGPQEKRLRDYIGLKTDRKIHKLVDIYGRMASPPLDGYCHENVYEFKTCPVLNFYDLDMSRSEGAFVSKFKLQHLELACGRNLNRRPDNCHFKEGYYVYVDKSGHVFWLAASEITELVETGCTKRVKDWEKAGNDGWMIPTRYWEKLGYILGSAKARI